MEEQKLKFENDELYCYTSIPRVGDRVYKKN